MLLVHLLNTFTVLPKISNMGLKNYGTVVNTGKCLIIFAVYCSKFWISFVKIGENGEDFCINW